MFGASFGSRCGSLRHSILDVFNVAPATLVDGVLGKGKTEPSPSSVTLTLFQPERHRPRSPQLMLNKERVLFMEVFDVGLGKEKQAGIIGCNNS